MSAGLDSLKHIVVVMMGGRSFDHMLGSLKAVNPRIDGLTGQESNPDRHGNQVFVQPLAEFKSELNPTSDSRFETVDLQIFGGDQSATRTANMQGFVRSYEQLRHGATNAEKVMHYFPQDKLPVLTSLATNFAVFDRWFSSVPGPPICNRAFAHYGTSFGQVGMYNFYAQGEHIYKRLQDANHTAKIYYFDESNLGPETVKLAQSQPYIIEYYDQFLADCKNGNLPNYSYLEPNHTVHTTADGIAIASDQDLDHDVRAGEIFIASVYNAIRLNPDLWASTAMLIVYQEHGGFYDHVPPPACAPDGYSAGPANTGLNFTFNFDRLGVRVPAILISPWIPKGTVVSSGRIFEHASIPATLTDFFIGNFDQCTPREKAASTFLDVLSLPQMRADHLIFNTDLASQGKPNSSASPLSDWVPPGVLVSQVDGKATSTDAESNPIASPAPNEATVVAPPSPREGVPPNVPPFQTGPSTHVARDRWTTVNSLEHYPYAYAIYRFLTDPETKPPLAVSIQAPWGGGKTSLMRMIQTQLDPDAINRADQTSAANATNTGSATVKRILQEMETAADQPSTSATAPRDASVPSLSYTPAKNGGSSISEPTVPPIQKPGERRVTIWFNAWKYESTSQVWAGLADCIVQQIGERLGPVERELFWFRLQLGRIDAEKIRRKIHEELFSTFVRRLSSWLPAYVMGLALATFAAIKHAWLPASGLAAAEFVAGCLQFWKVKSETENKPARISLGDFVRAPDYAANLGFVHDVVQDLRRVFSLIPSKHLPMVVFIDDLDRCSPGKVAAVVEAVNLFLAGEFPDCMFILGIDDEMVAAALDQAHSDVIAKLPLYARTSSIGWRFMDKFVQLPFVIPTVSPEDHSHFIESLLSQDAGAEINMQVRDIAARLVEQTESASTTPEEVVDRVNAQQPLAQGQQDALRQEVKVIQDMNENIKKFTDQEKDIRDAIALHAKRYFINPRDTKRFVNLFRFYYFLRAARQARGQPVPTVDQLCRWLALSLKWPTVVRWLRRRPTAQDGTSDLQLETLERLAGASDAIGTWQKSIHEALGLDLEQTQWLADRELYAFLRSEGSDFETGDRLSSCSNKGLW